MGGPATDRQTTGQPATGQPATDGPGQTTGQPATDRQTTGQPTTRAPLILGIESATSRVGCAIGGPDGVLATRESAEPRRHAESLVPQIAETLEESGVALADIGVIAVDVGPGLYTGLRVGIATAVTMADALGAAMVPVTSLELVAHQARRSCTNRRIDAVIDARRGELFHAAFGANGDPISEPAVLDPRDLVTMLANEAPETLLVGDGIEAHSETFAQGGFHTNGSSVYPSAETIVELAVAAAAAGKTVGGDSIRPLYLRGPDAQPIGIVAPEAAPTGETMRTIRREAVARAARERSEQERE